jgi:hypothetical protein
MQRVGRHVALHAVEIAERDPAPRERLQHAGAADEDHAHALRRQAAADEAADGAGTHHEHVDGHGLGLGLGHVR